MKKYTVCHLISSTGLYGAESVILNLMKAMKSEETIDCILGCLEDSDNRDCDLFCRAKESGLNAYQILLKDGFNPVNIFRLRKFFKDKGVDIIHLHGYKPAVLTYVTGKFIEIKQLATRHSWTSGNAKQRLYDNLEAWVIKKHNVSIAVSDRIKYHMIAKGIQENIIKVIPNGVDINDYNDIDQVQTAKLREEFSIPDGTVVIGNLARLIELKGHKYLIESAKRIMSKKENVMFLIAGEGNMKDELISLTKRYGIDSKVKFIGFRKDSKALLKLFDIFVLPSTDEGTPMALLEAMASGCAVVAAKVGEIPNIIDDNIDGFLINKRDVNELSDRLLRLLEDGGKAKLFSEKAKRKISEKFSIERVVSQYIMLYRNLMKNPV